MDEKELTAKLSEVNDRMKARLDEVKAEIKAENKTEIDQWKAHFDQRIADGAPKEAMDRVIANVERRMEARLKTFEQELSRPSGNPAEIKSAGELIVGMPDVRDWIQRQSRVWTKSSMQMKVDGGSFFLTPEGLLRPTASELKTNITSATLGSGTGGVLMPQQIPGIVRPGVRRVRVRDLMPRFATTNNAVFFVSENAFTNASSPTAETISKPESTLTFTTTSRTVQTIAATLPVARQALDDFAALPAYINTRLIEGLKDAEDSELLAGDGTGSHLTGLSSAAGAYDTTRNAASDTRIDQANHMISQIEDANLMADGLIFHPRDWRACQLIKDQASNIGNYVLGGPRGDAAPFLWGLPVATTTAVTVGTFFGGAFQGYAQVWDRMDAAVDMSTEHWDFFVKNLVMFRAEERLTFVVLRNDAVLFGTFV